MLIFRLLRAAKSLLVTRRLCAIVLPAVAALLLPDSLSADPPTAKYLYPAGGVPGRQIAVTAGGHFSHWPPQVWSSSNKIQFKPDSEESRFQVAIADDTDRGVYWIRFYDTEGATAVRPFIVGALPTLDESEPNDDWRKPQRVSLPVTIDGRLDEKGDCDVYAFSLRAGETLIASLQAHEILRSPMDALLQLCRKDGFVIQQIDDTVGLDPRIVFTAAADDTYLIRAFAFLAEPDETLAFAGGSGFVYRMTLTAGPFVDHVLPMSASRSTDTTVQLHGWNLAKRQSTITVPADGQRRVATVFDSAVAGFVRIPYLDLPAVVNNVGTDLQQPLSVAIPVCVSGHIREEHGEQAFVFEAQESQCLSVRVESQSLGFLLDAAVRLSDANGTVLVVDDGHKEKGKDKQPYDPQFTHSFTADGIYTLSVRDLHGRGGPRFVYRLTIDEAKLGYHLAVEKDAYVAAGNTPLEIPVKIERLHGFEQRIEIAAEGLPDHLSVAAALSEPEGDSSQAVKLAITGNGTAWSGPIKIYGSCRAVPDRRQYASFPLAVTDEVATLIWMTSVKSDAAVEAAATKIGVDR